MSSQNQLTLAQQSALQKVLARPNEGYSIVQVGNLATAQVKGELSLTLPGFSTFTLVAKVTRAEYTDDNNYIWGGPLKDGSGDVILISRDGGRIGLINQGAVSYMLHPLGGNKCALTKQSKEIRTTECGNTSAASSPTLEWCEDEVNNCAATIDVLLLFTTPATEWLSTNAGGWSPLHIFLAVEVMNYSMANSGIPSISTMFPAKQRPCQ